MKVFSPAARRFGQSLEPGRRIRGSTASCWSAAAPCLLFLGFRVGVRHCLCVSCCCSAFPVFAVVVCFVCVLVHCMIFFFVCVCFDYIVLVCFWMCLLFSGPVLLMGTRISLDTKVLL